MFVFVPLWHTASHSSVLSARSEESMLMDSVYKQLKLRKQGPEARESVSTAQHGMRSDSWANETMFHIQFREKSWVCVHLFLKWQVANEQTTAKNIQEMRMQQRRMLGSACLKACSKWEVFSDSNRVFLSVYLQSWSFEGSQCIGWEKHLYF